MNAHQDSPNRPRRRLLQISAVIGLGVMAYAYRRGIRYPTISLEPAPIPDQINWQDARFILKDFLKTAIQDNDSIALRAFAPEPQIEIQAPVGRTLRFELNNLASDAVLTVKPGTVTVLSEKINGISRTLEIKTEQTSGVRLKWRLPKMETYSFAAIGDTGAGLELEWCIQRAHQLGARFLLHLGDFNYQDGDYDRAIRLFRQSPLPCYVSIGNHDFHDSGLVHQQFLQGIGPLNHQFAIGRTRYVNLDTAANIFPVSGGHRGILMQQLIQDSDKFDDTVAFSHRPLHDPDPGEAGDHDIGSEAERDWLIRNLKLANISTLLSGHIHIFDRRKFHGIDNIIVGQGLGHQDLIVNGDHSKMALGKVDEQGLVSYEFAPLAMPMEMHCHPRTNAVKRSLSKAPHAHVIEQIDRACSAITKKAAN